MEVFNLLKVKSMEELEKIRKEIIRDIEERERKGIEIMVGMGTCGIAAGAKSIRNAILGELKRKEVEVTVKSTGCIGRCSEEPIITIKKNNYKKIKYQ